MSSLLESLTSFDPDLLLQPAVALRLQVSDNDSESTVHKHRKGQLILALHGSVTCKVPDGLWLVPPHCAVWIPGGLMHRNQVSANGRLCFLFVEPDVAALPDQCCTLRDDAVAAGIDSAPGHAAAGLRDDRANCKAGGGTA